MVEESAQEEEASTEDGAAGKMLNISLSRLTHFFLGMPLDKGEQVSNWNLRPLREDQKVCSFH